MVDNGDVTFGVRDTVANASTQDRFVEREVTATVKTAAAKRLVVELPRERAFHRKTVLTIPLAEAAAARLESDDPARIEPGATVVRLEAIRLAIGDLVASTDRSPGRSRSNTTSFSPRSATAIAPT